jgi:CPA2 family monovalent cation:H+ antiporter-2
MNFNVLEIILSVFFITLIVTFIFRRLRLSVILGYLLVGAMMGPHALGLVPDSENIKSLAEFGIVFLMFTVGLEFSLPKLFSLRFPVFVIGGIQVLLTVLITYFCGILLGMTHLSALVTGSIVAMSSTAIVVKQLNDQLELHTPYGLNAVGILLFQDLAVIPLFILIASSANPNASSLSYVLLWALIKGVIAILLIFFLGRTLLKPLFRMISQTRAIELFTLAVLLVTLTAAWLTHLLGLSFALGAFLAGMMLAETEFRHQIEIEIRPFRDILLGLFFVTIGMLVDVSTWHQTWIWILLLLTALVIGKILLITIISYFSKNNISVSLRTGLVLAQGGEFGFAFLTLALNHEIIPQEYAQVILAALLISIVLSPLFIRFNKKIAEFLLPTSTKAAERLTQQTIENASQNLTKHIVICGFGRVGQHIARLLDKVGIPYIGLEYDAELVKNASLAGDNVIYGDASHPDILRAANIKQADALVICVSDHNAASRILAMARQKYPRLPILARCRDEFELKELKELGATEIIAELFETSLTMSHHILQLISIPRDKIANIIQEIRNTDYDLLQKVFIGEYSDEGHEAAASSLYSQLLPISIDEGAYSVGHTLDELNLKEIGVEIMAIRRGNSKQVRPRGHTVIHVNDIVIVYGPSTNLEAAERRLLEG